MSASDARDPSREVKPTPPRSWRVESTDAFGSVAMFLAGITMVTKNRRVLAHISRYILADIICRYLVWPILVMAISNAINQRPLRQKDGGSSAWSNLA
ncbi:hypothetical protein EDD15DRAFT_1576562 [Pisolithus albus]|nr:hypothetical protein EDD15DRAFT_1576562 [Pisolithus albus]